MPRNNLRQIQIHQVLNRNKSVHARIAALVGRLNMLFYAAQEFSQFLVNTLFWDVAERRASRFCQSPASSEDVSVTSIRETTEVPVIRTLNRSAL